MTESSSDTPIDAYLNYLHQSGACLDSNQSSCLIADLSTTDWDAPVSAFDLNNFAVMMLVAAEQDENHDVRIVNVEIALNALVQGVELNEHPLCSAHLLLLRCMMGEIQSVGQDAFSNLIELFQAAYNSDHRMPLGLIYLPRKWETLAIARTEKLHQFLQVKDGYAQALLLVAEVLYRAQLVFYNTTALRFLHLACHLSPTSIFLNLKLGVASLIQQQWEGLLYVQQARKLAPDCAPILQAIYLAYREPEQPKIGNFWLKTARQSAQHHPQSLSWKWTELAIDHPFTYVPFEEDVLLTVEPNIRSIVTSMLLVEGDWFEAEMELWRHQLQPGMTVIDVGANVGVYTFSAARRVGASGRVLAIEPFSGCVRCLEETRRINAMPWVTVCKGAASDRNGNLHLFLRSASELNRVVEDDMDRDVNQTETVPCFTLDSLIDSEQVSRVDWLKLDAEDHELQVLLGSDRLLTQFAPKILYENTSGINPSDPGADNRAVAEFLLAKGYRLFRYRPYLEDLVPLEDLSDLRGNLNIIALPAYNEIIRYPS